MTVEEVAAINMPSPSTSSARLSELTAPSLGEATRERARREESVTVVVQDMAAIVTDKYDRFKRFFLQLLIVFS